MVHVKQDGNILSLDVLCLAVGYIKLLSPHYYNAALEQLDERNTVKPGIEAYTSASFDISHVTSLSVLTGRNRGNC